MTNCPVGTISIKSNHGNINFQNNAIGTVFETDIDDIDEAEERLDELESRLDEINSDIDETEVRIEELEK